MFSKKEVLNSKLLPKHVAFIIDGNGRWAQKRKMPRSYGHNMGMKNLETIVKECFKIGIKVVTVFGFSTENWNRPKQEVDFLIDLFYKSLLKFKDDLIKENVVFRTMGDCSKFPKKLSDEILNVKDLTKNNNGCILNIAINYGGKDEIINAVNKIIKDKKQNIDTLQFEKYLYSCNLPDPDFIIRTSGEERISNFMLWQCAYSEFYFTKTLWPDFSTKDLTNALLDYQKRNRRFGRIKED